MLGRRGERMNGRSDPRRDAGGLRVRHLDYPVEATTANGELATVEAVTPADESCFFLGFVWPVGDRKIKAAWRRDGRALGHDPGFDIDPDSPDVESILRECAASPD